jgi:hypothetical protein
MNIEKTSTSASLLVLGLARDEFIPPSGDGPMALPSRPSCIVVLVLHIIPNIRGEGEVFAQMVSRFWLAEAKG